MLDSVKPATQSRHIQENKSVRFVEDDIPTASTSQVDVEALAAIQAQAEEVERSETHWAGALPAAVSYLLYFMRIKNRC